MAAGTGIIALCPPHAVASLQGAVLVSHESTAAEVHEDEAHRDHIVSIYRTISNLSLSHPNQTKQPSSSPHHFRFPETVDRLILSLSQPFKPITKSPNNPTQPNPTTHNNSIKINAASAAAILAALAAMPAVYAHGHVSEITANGETVPGTTPEWQYNDNKTPGWYAMNQDNGFVEPSSFGSADIICHKVNIYQSSHTPIN
jgi:hypothetical protein